MDMDKKVFKRYAIGLRFLGLFCLGLMAEMIFLFLGWHGDWLFEVCILGPLYLGMVVFTFLPFFERGKIKRSKMVDLTGLAMVMGVLHVDYLLAKMIMQLLGL